MDVWGLFVIGYLPYFSFSSHHGLEKITSRIYCDGVFTKQQVFVIATQTVFRQRFITPSNNAVYDTTNIRMWTKRLEDICSTLKTENMDDVDT